MRTAPGLLAVVSVCTVLALGACDSGSGSGPPSAAAPDNAACSISAQPTAGSSSARPVAGGSSSASGPDKVGVLVPQPAPGMVSGHRDIALLTHALREAGLVPVVRAAQPGGPGFLSLSRSLVDAGVRVLVVGTGDPAATVRAEHVAELAGVPVIEYGGLTIGGSATYAVSPDYAQIGRLQARTMIRCLTARGITDPTIILVDGGTDVDENAVLLALGAHRVLDPLVSAGNAQLAEETAVTGWRTERAAAVFTQALDLAGGRVDGVIAANDAIATAVIDVLAQRGLDTTLVAGQGPGGAGLQNVSAGRQSLTVQTDLASEADAAAQLARALVSRDRTALAALPLARFDDPTAPIRGLRTLMVPGRVVTQSATASAGSPAPRPPATP